MEREQLAALVKQLRGDLSQEEFGARLDLSKPTVQRYEDGRIGPSPDGLKALAEFAQRTGKLDICRALVLAFREHYGPLMCEEPEAHALSPDEGQALGLLRDIQVSDPAVFKTALQILRELKQVAELRAGSAEARKQSPRQRVK